MVLNVDFESNESVLRRNMSNEFGSAMESGVASHITCWACMSNLATPTASGVQAPMFKCGWCGAISKLDRFLEKEHKSAISAKLKSVLPALRAAFVAFVGLLLLSVPTLGFTYLLPNLYSGVLLALHMMWSLFLAANTYFNFIAAVMRSPGIKHSFNSAMFPPGPVDIHMPPPNTQVEMGAYDNCMYCLECQDVKPPQTHHCSRCKTCVMDMDHHCIFLNNCVGRGNIRHFILLLLFLTISCTYTFWVGCILHVRRWEEAAGVWQRVLLPIVRSRRYWEGILVTPRFLMVAPAWQGAVTYLMSLTGGSCIGILLLLASQLRLIMRGQTYVESLAAAPSSGRNWQGSLRRIFGSEHPVKWLRLTWEPPPGAAASQIKKGD